jgi:hypothetical protein
MNVRQSLAKIFSPVNLQTVYGGLTSFIAVDSSISNLIVPIVRYSNLVEEEYVLLTAMGFALIPASLFAASDAYCHRQVSEGLHSDTLYQDTTGIHLTPFQYLMLGLHYTHDIAEAMFPWLALNNAFSTLGWYRKTDYSQAVIACGLFSAAAAGTFQEVSNTRKGFLIANAKRKQDVENAEEKIGASFSDDESGKLLPPAEEQNGCFPHLRSMMRCITG